MSLIRYVAISVLLLCSLVAQPAFSYDAVDIAAEQITLVYPQKRYVKYGNGPDVFDCTGLTKYAYGHVGIDLPRTSGEQGNVGVLVVSDVTKESNLQKLQRGDLLFFDTKDRDDDIPNVVNHAAIYEGDGAFIHASWVDVDIVRYSFNDAKNGTWWKSHFLFAKRLPLPPGPSTKYSTGDVVGVTVADVNVKGDPLGRDLVPVGDDENPDLVTSTEKQSPPAKGSIGTRPIYSGYPYTAAAHWRWLVDFESGADGWVADDFLWKVGAQTLSAQDDVATAQSGLPEEIDVLENDDPDTLTITSTTPGTHGSADISNNGVRDTVTYTSRLEFVGTDTFTYTVSDGNGGSDTATVTVTVSETPPPANNPPTAQDDTATTQSGVAVDIDVLANDYDPDGDTLTITITLQATNGAAVPNATDITYTPNSGFVGMDTFTYAVSDGNGGSATATVTVTVTAVSATTFSIIPQAVSVNEGNGTTTFTVTRSDGTTAQTVYVSTIQDQGSTNNGDYVGKVNEPVIFAVNESAQQVIVQILVDTEVEGDETFSLIVENTPDGTVLASATFTIIGGGSPTPTGGKIAFHSERDGNFEIYIMNADGSGQTNLTNNPDSDMQPSLSPDGSQIAFSSHRDGSWNVYVMNADGSGVTRLTDNLNNDNSPNWSPDGSQIAFYSTRDDNGEIYVMNADGSGQTNLTNNPALDGGPKWSPDGSQIAFSSYRDGSFDIYAMNADGSGVTRLTDNLVDDVAGSWSPDGSQIAFYSTRDGNGEIYVMNTDGSGVTRLTDNLNNDSLPSWSPDGSQIAFTSDRDNNAIYFIDYDIYIMTADGSEVTRLTDSPASDSYPSWSVSTLMTSHNPLNDTGITWGGDYPDGNNATCTSNIAGPQDCHQGRDFTHNDDSDGHAGFSYTKISSAGVELSASATSWSCVKDNVTGLTWEVKTDDGGIHDKYNIYLWGGKTHLGSGYGTYYDDWDTLVDGSNSANFCGASDWRVPTIKELKNLVGFGRFNPAIDTVYFPNTPSSRFWSASPYASNSSYAWVVDFDGGGSYYYGRGYYWPVRLVRGGQ